MLSRRPRPSAAAQDRHRRPQRQPKAATGPIYRNRARTVASHGPHPLFQPQGRSASVDSGLRWQRKAAGRTRLRRAKRKVPSHRPVNPALLLRNLQIQIVIGLLDRLGVPPRGEYVSGCRIVGEVIGLHEDSVRGIWEMRFTAAMRKHSKAVAERTGLLDTTEA